MTVQARVFRVGPQDAPTPSDAPIFIVGTERSGSNLLRLILNSHPHIAVPHPPHILRYLGSIERHYDRLPAPERLKRMAADALKLARLHILPWQQYPGLEELLSDVRSGELVEIYAALYRWYARHEGKPRWGCKSTFVIHNIDEIAPRYPQAKFIWLLRDPRDVAASSKSSVFNPCTPLLTARVWRKQQEIGARQAEKLGGSRWMQLRYEDLVSDPRAQLQKLCVFLGEDYFDVMAAFFTKPDAAIAASQSYSWRNVQSPIFSTSVRSFGDRLTAREIADVEAEAGDMMRLLGYPTAAPVPSRPSRAIGARLQEPVRRIAMEASALQTDRNWWRRWRRGLFLLYLHVARRLQHRWRSGARGYAGASASERSANSMSRISRFDRT